MNKLLAFMLLALSTQTYSFFDFKMDETAARILITEGYTSSISRRLSYTGLTCILLPLIARASAKCIKEIKNNSAEHHDNPLQELSWEQMSERYISLGKKLLFAGVGLYAGGSFLTYMTLKYELNSYRR